MSYTSALFYAVEKKGGLRIVEKDGIRSRRTGKLECEPEVFYGLNMLIVVDTVHIEQKE